MGLIVERESMHSSILLVIMLLLKLLMFGKIYHFTLFLILAGKKDDGNEVIVYERKTSKSFGWEFGNVLLQNQTEEDLVGG